MNGWRLSGDLYVHPSYPGWALRIVKTGFRLSRGFRSPSWRWEVLHHGIVVTTAVSHVAAQQYVERAVREQEAEAS